MRRSSPRPPAQRQPWRPSPSSPQRPSSQAAPALAYVALGDSYSAASGVLPPDPTAPPKCLRSTLNYPHVLARRPARS